MGKRRVENGFPRCKPRIQTGALQPDQRRGCARQADAGIEQRRSGKIIRTGKNDHDAAERGGDACSQHARIAAEHPFDNGFLQGSDEHDEREGYRRDDVETRKVLAVRFDVRKPHRPAIGEISPCQPNAEADIGQRRPCGRQIVRDAGISNHIPLPRDASAFTTYRLR